MAAPKADTGQTEPGQAVQTRQVYVVIYPTGISVQPKDADGKPAGDPVTFVQGAALTPETEWNAQMLVALGHVTPLQVAAT